MITKNNVIFIKNSIMDKIPDLAYKNDMKKILDNII